jgi:hypothetical protein
MSALLAFAAALVAFRLSALLLGRWRASRRPELLVWAWALAAYAVAAAAIAWGEAAQWDGRTFRVYYGAGALLTVPLLGCGSLLLAGVRRAGYVACACAGAAVGVAVAMAIHGTFEPHGIPAAQDHLDWPPRIVAIVFNIAGTLAVVVVALRSLRRRPLGNALILAGVVAAALGSGLAGLGAGGAAIGIAVGVALLYAGFVTPSSRH